MTDEVKPPSLEDLVPAKDAAQELGIHYNTLLRRIERGKIKCERIGWGVFITRDEINRHKPSAAA